MIATIDIADIGALSTLRAFRRRPTPVNVPGLRWLDVAAAAPLASKSPPRLRRAVLFAMWDDEAAAYAYADAQAGHPQAIARQRRKDFHHESAFVRYAVMSTSGTLPGHPI